MDEAARPDPGLFDLDRDNLDRDWEGLPRQIWKAGERLADARADHERAKADCDVTYAEVSLHVRQDPAFYQLDKVVEDTVKQTTLTQERYQEAARKVTDAKHRVDVLQAYLNALEAKKRALESMVQLHATGYFAQPRARGEGKDFMERRRVGDAVGRRKKGDRE